MSSTYAQAGYRDALSVVFLGREWALVPILSTCTFHVWRILAHCG